jgi:arylformamidase
MDYEREYNNRAMVPEHPAIIAGWASDSAAFRARHPEARLDLAYGEKPAQKLDLFGPEDPKAPLLAFIHGGYWQALSKNSFSWLAEQFLGEGVRVAVIDHTLCPETTLDGIVEEIRQALGWLFHETGQRPVVAGHSAGGHLTAMSAVTDWPARDPALPADLVRGALGLSGLYDLDPLRQTYVNEKVDMDAETARRNSPVFLAPAWKLPVLLAVGGDESREYHRQTADLAKAWRNSCASIQVFVRPGLNHFTILDPLKDKDSDLSKALLRLFR